MALEETGHKQPPTGTPLETGNSTAHDVLKRQVRMKGSKAFDVRHRWLKHCIAQRQFNLCFSSTHAGLHASSTELTASQSTILHPIITCLMRCHCLQHPQANTVTAHVQGCVAPVNPGGRPRLTTVRPVSLTFSFPFTGQCPSGLCLPAQVSFCRNQHENWHSISSFHLSQHERVLQSVGEN
jgi:hypothetical protein